MSMIELCGFQRAVETRLSGNVNKRVYDVGCCNCVLLRSFKLFYSSLRFDIFYFKKFILEIFHSMFDLLKC